MEYAMPIQNDLSCVQNLHISNLFCIFAPIFGNVSDFGHHDNKYSITVNQFRKRVKNIRLLISTSSNSVNLFQE